MSMYTAKTINSVLLYSVYVNNISLSICICIHEMARGIFFRKLIPFKMKRHWTTISVEVEIRQRSALIDEHPSL